MNKNQKFGFVSIVGEPNVGKSTLINALVESKVSITSSKVQTTRSRVLGVIIKDNAQIAFVDTPGIFDPNKRNRMEKAIVASAKETLKESDIILFLVDVSKKISEQTEKVLDLLKSEKSKNIILVLNKIDKIKKDKLLEISLKLNQRADFSETFMISAIKKDGLEKLLFHLASILPDGPWHYPEDHVSDMPMRLMAAEITREKLFRSLHQELPYNLTVETETWEEFENKSIKINQIIFVSRESQKKIILGKGGSMIKKIGESARKELEELFDTQVHLKLFVKVQEDWLENKEHYEIWGLDSSV